MMKQKKKWYEYVLITIVIVICFFKGHDWVNTTIGRTCRCCGKTEMKPHCGNCVHCNVSHKWCRKLKIHVKGFPAVCENHVPKEEINNEVVRKLQISGRKTPSASRLGLV